MRKKLHPLVLTVGIVQIVLGLGGMCWGGINAVANAAVIGTKGGPAAGAGSYGAKMAPGGGGAAALNGQDLQDELLRRAPSWLYLQTALMAWATFLSFLMVVGGVGLCFMQSWARWLTIGYAALSIFGHLVEFGIQLVVVFPVILAISNEVAAAGTPQATGMAGGFKFGFLGAAVFAFALALYPLLIAILLLIPPVNRAFRDEPAPDREPDDYRDRDDYPDRDDYRDRFRGGDYDRYAER
jgi:hypothetical protein